MCDRVSGAYSELLIALSKLTKYVKQLGSKSGVIFSLGPFADDQYELNRYAEKYKIVPLWIFTVF
jgi:hypothetical protein